MSNHRLDVLFDESGRPVDLKFAAPSPIEDPREVITDILLCNGVALDDVDRVVCEVLRIAVEIAAERIADGIRIRAAELGNSPAEIAARRVLLGDCGVSRREHARAAGCSAQAILKHERKIRLPLPA